ncbi:hypothetical protein [Lentibacillus saliphilus]|nr:hypothetical protein [Lentibacillus saliphilus]
MKKRTYVYSVLMIIIIMTGCQKEQEPPDHDAPTTDPIHYESKKP